MMNSGRGAECPSCGEPIRLGYRITKQGGTRVWTVASRPTDRGVTCKACAEKRIAELDARDQQIRTLLRSDSEWG